MARTNAAKWIFPILLIIVTITFFISKWALDGAFILSDIFHTNAPIEDAFARAQHKGEAPVWDSAFAGGYPLLGTPQLSFYYPPHVILRQFFSGITVINISLLVHSLVAATGMFFLLKRNKLGDTPAITGALTFTFGGAMVAHYITANIFFAFTWVPLIIFFLQWYLETGTGRYLVWWITTSFLQVLSGHQQIIPLTLIIELILVLLIIARTDKIWQKITFLIFGGLLIILLSSAQLIPMAAVIPQTDRGQKQPVENLLDFSFTPAAFKAIILPFPYGKNETAETHPILSTGSGDYNGPRNEIEVGAFLGPIIILLALIALILTRENYKTLIWQVGLITTIIGLILAPGEYSPIYRWLVISGNQRYFNIPARFFLYTHLGIAILAAVGLHNIQQTWERGPGKKAFKQITILLITVTSILPIITVAWVWHNNLSWSAVKEPILFSTLKNTPEYLRLFASHQISDTGSHQSSDIAVWDPVRQKRIHKQTFTSPYNQLSAIAIMFSSENSAQSGSLLFNLASNHGETIRSTKLALNDINDSQWTLIQFEPIQHALGETYTFSLTSTVDKTTAPLLIVHTNESNDYAPGKLETCVNNLCHPVIFGTQPADIAFLPINRMKPKHYSYDILTPSVAAGLGIHAAQWLGPLALSNTAKYFSEMTSNNDQLNLKESRSLINRFPVTHIAGYFPPWQYGIDLQQAEFTEEASLSTSGGFIRLFKNEQASPRIHLASQVIAADTPKKQRRAIQSLKDTTVVASDILNSKKFSTTGVATKIVENNQHMLLTVKPANQAFLVVRDTYFPGWEVAIDGEKQTIHLVDGVHRGVIIPPGNHVISFTFFPKWFALSSYLTLSGLAISAALLALYYKKTNHARIN